jgi:hypothetical protein
LVAASAGGRRTRALSGMVSMAGRAVGQNRTPRPPAGIRKISRLVAAARMSNQDFTEFAHRGGNRFIVRADEKLTAFVELESAVRDSIS